MRNLILPHRDLAAVMLLMGGSAFGQDANETTPDRLLLKDYQPRSIYKIQTTRIEKARYPVIDVHSHVYAKTPLLVEQWRRNMKAVGIEKAVIMVSGAGQRFDEAVALYGKFPDQFEIWCGLDYTGFDQPGFAERAIKELERCVELGAVGVGELSDKGRGLRGGRDNPDAFPMHIDDERMDPILARCADLKLPVNIHVGEDKWMYEPMDRHNDGLMNAYKWRIPNEPGVLRHQNVIATLDRALAKHPRVTFIACHLANTCYDLSILGKMFDQHENLYGDIGARFGELAPIPRHVAKFFTKYQDRILYGTDMGIDREMYRTTFRVLESEDEHFYPNHISNYHWAWHGFGLEDSVLKKIYRENARGLFARLRSN